MMVSLRASQYRHFSSAPRSNGSPSRRCGTKIFAGLKSRSSGVYPDGSSSRNAEFFHRVHRSLSLGNGQASRPCMRMMSIGTPMVPYRTPGEGTWQWIDLWNALYRERIVFIAEEIDEEFSNMILSTLLYLDTIDDSQKLYLYINSVGGDLTPCLALYDTIKSLQSPIGTACLGIAYNLAGFLLASGEKGSRLGMPLSSVCLGPPAGSAYGQTDDIQNETMELLRIRDYLFNETSKATGQPIEKVFKDLEGTKFFDAKGALEYGIIDRIVKPPSSFS